MSKCGSTMLSIVLSRASRLFCSSSCRVSIVLPSSSTRFCTTWFGGRFAARSCGAAARMSTQNREYTKRMTCPWLPSSASGLLAFGLCGRLLASLVAALAGIAADQIFADQLLELHRTLRQHDFVAVLEHVRRAARLYGNVLVSQ